MPGKCIQSQCKGPKSVAAAGPGTMLASNTPTDEIPIPQFPICKWYVRQTFSGLASLFPIFYRGISVGGRVTMSRSQKGWLPRIYWSGLWCSTRSLTIPMSRRASCNVRCVLVLWLTLVSTTWLRSQCNSRWACRVSWSNTFKSCRVRRWDSWLICIRIRGNVKNFSWGNFRNDSRQRHSITLWSYNT